MRILVQQIINGLTIGSVYALIALGYTMVYGIIELINFAHGDIYMIGAYGGLIALTLLGAAHLSGMGALITGVVAGMLLSAAYGFTVEKLAYRPLRNASRLSLLITALGVSIFLENFVMIGQGAADRTYVSLSMLNSNFVIDGVSITANQIVIFIAAVAIMLGLDLFINRTMTGRAMKAASQDSVTVQLMGIDTDRIISLTFIIGSALAGAAGVLVGFYYGVVTFYIGYLAGIKAFTAAVLGGIGNIRGAMVGGLVLGLLESLGAAYISSDYKDAFAFIVLILLLLIKPSGLFGNSRP
ncbi:MAG: branched-chain amino acid ABC transporter permease [Deltaproteobacteria bacterium]|nr:branched-chain amino acid ABC transporter permease [Deltaproteobacteria bacterium]MCL5277139.1 branched-chain amino acid ABC transporter permease [Deltaproteobacteria bacterium]